jgi:two-component system, cell cycle sensor histidine kinase and response regulator CckA
MPYSSMTKNQLISEIRQLSKTLQESESRIAATEQHSNADQRLSPLLTNLPGGILTENGQHNVTQANQQFCDMFSLPWSARAIPGRDRREVDQHLKTLFKDGKSFVQRLDAILADGKPVYNELLFLQDGRTLERDFIPMDDGQGRAEYYWFYRDVTHRMRIEKALSESEARYRQTLDSMMEGCQIIGYDWKYLYVNDSVCRHAQIAKEKLLGHTMLEVYPGIAETPLFATLRTCMATRQSELMENEFVYPDGSKRCFQLSIQPVPEGIFILSMDITEHKMTQDNVRKSEELYRLLTENVSDVIWILDLETRRFRYVSPSVEQLRGYSVEEVMSQDVSDTLTPTSMARFSQFLAERLQEWRQGRCLPHLDEVEQPCKDGSIVYTEATTRFVVNPESGHLEVYGVSRDITERKETENALRQSEKLLRTVIDSTPDFIFAKDRNFRFVLANKSYAERINLPEEEIIGKTDQELGCPEKLIFGDPKRDIRGYRADDMYVLERNTALHIPYDPVQLADGTEIILDTIKLPLYNQKNEIWAVLGVSRDFTARKRAEEEKARLEEYLRRSQKLETIGTLAGGIAHDFNNLLTPIMGYADMVLSGINATDPLHEDITHILKAAARARDLVEQILIFSREIEKERAPIFLHLIINEALKLLRPVLPSTIEIQRDIDPSCERILADASQMHQVVVNLCTNAYQAMEAKGGILTIALKQVRVDAGMAKIYSNLHEAEYVCLTVGDTGIGMDEITKERIFEPFFTTKEIGKGTGMGLSVVHGIIQSHHGDILVYSELGKGSVFHVYLPIVKSEEMVKEALPEIQKGFESILVVDDDEQVLYVLEKMLKRLGYTVAAFSSSVAALEAFSSQPGAYDLVIFDLIMPNMTGLDLSEQMHKIQKSLPIILMTGYDENIPEEKKVQYGIQQVIVKPVTWNELASTIRFALAKQNGG